MSSGRRSGEVGWSYAEAVGVVHSIDDDVLCGGGVRGQSFGTLTYGDVGGSGEGRLGDTSIVGADDDAPMVIGADERQGIGYGVVYQRLSAKTLDILVWNAFAASACGDDIYRIGVH